MSTVVVTPSREEFVQRAKEGNLIPVYREILADRLTPVSAFEHLVAHSPNGENGYAFLLESVEGGERIGRYSFLGIDPGLVFRSRGKDVTLIENGVTTHSQLEEGEDPLTRLQSLMSRYQYVETPGLPKFSGGAVGFFSYDVVRFFEELPDNNPDELEVDDSFFLFTDSLLIFDHVRHRLKVLCNAHITQDPDTAYTAALAKIEALISVIRTPTPPAPAFHRDPSLNTPQFEACFPREEYEQAVERCKEYIHAGDAFQIVLAQRFKVKFQAPIFGSHCHPIRHP